MTDPDGESGLSDVGRLGDEFSFSLYDGFGREVVAFAFHDEATARRAHRAMQMAISDAVAVSPAFEQPDLFTLAHQVCRS